ncbi:MAG: hypothetical protein WEA59_08565 [Ferruginibacter sp.]
MQPVFFLNKLDITGNIWMSAGLQQLIIQSSGVRCTLDLLYFSLPFVMYVAVVREGKMQLWLAIFTAIGSMMYCYLLSTMSLVSIEVFIAWMIFPFIFAGSHLQGFYFRLHMVRYLFILFFFSTALWKLRAGGLFNVEQFSAILLKQHLPVLVSAPNNWFSQFIQWLIDHRNASYLLYFIATMIEFVFVLGFFTKKYDRILAVLFVCFLIFNYWLMEINYFSWLPFLGCLYFSRYSLSSSSN